MKRHRLILVLSTMLPLAAAAQTNELGADCIDERVAYQEALASRESAQKAVVDTKARLDRFKSLQAAAGQEWDHAAQQKADLGRQLSQSGTVDPQAMAEAEQRVADAAKTYRDIYAGFDKDPGQAYSDALTVEGTAENDVKWWKAKLDNCEMRTAQEGEPHAQSPKRSEDLPQSASSSATSADADDESDACRIQRKDYAAARSAYLAEQDKLKFAEKELDDIERSLSISKQEFEEMKAAFAKQRFGPGESEQAAQRNYELDMARVLSEVIAQREQQMNLAVTYRQQALAMKTAQSEATTKWNTLKRCDEKAACACTELVAAYNQTTGQLIALNASLSAVVAERIEAEESIDYGNMIVDSGNYPYLDGLTHRTLGWEVRLDGESWVRRGKAALAATTEQEKALGDSIAATRQTRLALTTSINSCRAYCPAVDMDQARDCPCGGSATRYQQAMLEVDKYIGYVELYKQYRFAQMQAVIRLEKELFILEEQRLRADEANRPYMERYDALSREHDFDIDHDEVKAAWEEALPTILELRRATERLKEIEEAIELARFGAFRFAPEQVSDFNHLVNVKQRIAARELASLERCRQNSCPAED